MPFCISPAQLALHRLTTSAPKYPALAGILVDPVRGLCAASNGSSLVEISAPKVEKFPAGSAKLANGESKPFVMAAKSAQAIEKALPKSRGADDPARFAALAAGPKPAFVVSDGRKSQAIAVQTLDAKFPDYDTHEIFPRQKPAASVALSAERLRALVEAARVVENGGVTLHVFNDRIVLMARSRDGASRAVLLQTAETPHAYVFPKDPQAAKPPASSAPASKTHASPAPKAPSAPSAVSRSDSGRGGAAAPASQSASYPAFRSRFGRMRTRRSWSGPSGASGGDPTCGQHAYHTWLLRTRDERKVTADDLHAADAAGEIERLKSLAAPQSFVATWRQWRKLFFRMAELAADDDTVCDVLNGLRDPQHASEVIDEWLKKDAPDTNGAPAAEEAA